MINYKHRMYEVLELKPRDDRDYDAVLIRSGKLYYGIIGKLHVPAGDLSFRGMFNGLLDLWEAPETTFDQIGMEDLNEKIEIK